MSQLLDDPLRRAREAFDGHDWAEAYRCLSEADATLELDAPNLELLAKAAYLAGHAGAAIAAWERAHGAHVRADARPAAAVAAIQTAILELEADSLASSKGWLTRAERLLDGEPESPVQGWLAAVRSVSAYMLGEIEASLSHARYATELGDRFGDASLQAMGLNMQGRALIVRGEVDEGLALLDETTALAVSGALEPLTTGYVYCSTVCGCQSVADYRRAQEWTAAMQRWCDRNRIAAFPGLCRAHRAELLRLRGEWSAAEGQARQAVEELRRNSALDTPWALHELGLVRLRAGDLDGAEDAFMEALTLGRVPQPGLALAQLARGDIAGAATSIADVLHNPREAPQSREAPFNTPLGRAALLPAQVEITVASGDLDTAASAAQELERTADLYATSPLRASAAWARGKVRLARGEVSEAREDFQAAVALWAEVNAPYEVARTRMGLGEVYRAAGNEASARLEFRAARMAFERLGASLDEERAQAAIGEAPQGRRQRKTFMFTDIVGSTSLLEVMGDEAWVTCFAGTTTRSAGSCLPTAARCCAAWVMDCSRSSTTPPRPWPVELPSNARSRSTVAAPDLRPRCASGSTPRRPPRRGATITARESTRRPGSGRSQKGARSWRVARR